MAVARRASRADQGRVPEMALGDYPLGRVNLWLSGTSRTLFEKRRTGGARARDLRDLPLVSRTRPNRVKLRRVFFDLCAIKRQRIGDTGKGMLPKVVCPLNVG